MNITIGLLLKYDAFSGQVFLSAQNDINSHPNRLSS